MKKIIFTLLISSFVTSVYSQNNDKIVKGPNSGSSETEKVTKKTGKDFSVYIPDENPDNKVRGLQRKFFDYDRRKAHQAKSHSILMEMKNGSLAATYNDDGKLTGIIENYTNVKLPDVVVHTILKKFPKWEIVNDTFLYVQEDGHVIKKQYHIKIKKENEVRKLTVHANGELLEENE